MPASGAGVRIEAMTGAHAAAVLAIYQAGIDEGNATFETQAPAWEEFTGARLAEIAKRIDIAATAIYNGMTADAVSDLDLSYTPPLGSPWDAVHIGTQAWTRHTRRP